MAYRIRAYRSASGRSDVLDWYTELSDKPRGQVRTKIDFLRAQQRSEWKEPHFKYLSGDGSGLGEIRFTLSKVQWRPFGFFGPDNNIFTVLIVAQEKEGKYKPPNAIKSAQRRKKEIIDGNAYSEDWIP